MKLNCFGVSLQRGTKALWAVLVVVSPLCKTTQHHAGIIMLESEWASVTRRKKEPLSPSKQKKKKKATELHLVWLALLHIAVSTTVIFLSCTTSLGRGTCSSYF